MSRAKWALICVRTVLGHLLRSSFGLAYGRISFCAIYSVRIAFLSALVCSLLLTSAGGAQSGSNAGEETYEQGVQFLAQEKWRSAAAAFQQVLKLDAHRADAENGLGVALGKTGDKPGSQAAFQRAIEIDPGYAEAHY